MSRALHALQKEEVAAHSLGIGAHNLAVLTNEKKLSVASFTVGCEVIHHKRGHGVVQKTPPGDARLYVMFDDGALHRYKDASLATGKVQLANAPAASADADGAVHDDSEDGAVDSSWQDGVEEVRACVAARRGRVQGTRGVPTLPE